VTDTILALVPQYGLWLVFGSVALSCLAVPLPSSVVVMTAGGFAASGDLAFWQVAATAFGAFFVGDQTAFHIGRRAGPDILDTLRRRKKLVAPIDKAEALFHKSGSIAVFASRTVLSPIGPYVSYICGSFKYRWLLFTLAAVPGAAFWAVAYSLLGYGVADQLSQYADLLSNGLMAIGALAVVAGSLFWMRKSWLAHHTELTADKVG